MLVGKTMNHEYNVSRYWNQSNLWCGLLLIKEKKDRESTGNVK